MAGEVLKDKQYWKMKGTTRDKPTHLMTKQASTIAHGSYNDAAMMANQGASLFLGKPSETLPHDNPFKSAKQRAYLAINKPEVAHKFAKHSKRKY